MTSNSRVARMVTRALIAALEEAPAPGEATNLRLIVAGLIGKAVGGDLAAIREIFDRVDGKAVAATPGEDDQPQKVIFEWNSEP
jgi:hypothetical protein